MASHAAPRRRVAAAAGLLLCAVGLVPAAHATTFSANPTNYLTVLTQLRPGDRMELASGTYRDGFTLTGVSGTASAPIVITGPADRSAVFTPRSCCNTVQLDGNSWLELRDFTIDNAGGDGVDAVNARGVTHHISVIGLRITNTNDAQGSVGISTKGAAWNWIIRGNTINTAGTGMYLGNSDGTMPFVAGLIEHNVFVDTIGYNIEIKHQLSRAGITGMPTGDQKTIIRHNVFTKANNASSGDMARPNLLVGHFPLSGLGANDLYEIYGNFFYQNTSEALFQGEGNIALYDNVFVNAFGDAINVVPHNDRPRNVTIFHNTVVASDRGINVSGGATGTTQRIIGNAVFAGTPVAGPNQSGNITGAQSAAGNYLTAPAAALGSLDLTPRAGMLTGSAIDLAQFSAFTDASRDFNGVTRVATYRGAYSADGPNAGWRLAIAQKPAAGSVSDPVITLSANPTSVATGGSTTLSWSSTNANACTASGGWSGARATSGSETAGPISAATTYTLTCTNTAGGSAARSVTVQLAAQPAPVVTLTASPTSVALGGASTLSWTATNATSCTATGGTGAWAGARSTQGSVSIGPISASTTFTLSCTGSGGTTQQSVTVALLPAPTLMLSATPTTVAPGGTSSLSWSSQNASTCTASGAWSGVRATSGSEGTQALNATSTFTLDCSGAGGSTSRAVTVSVSANPPSAPTVTLSAASASVQQNGSTTLTWTSSNATSCTAGGSWSGTRATSGSESTGSLQASATYTLNCAGPGGNASASATVSVDAAQTDEGEGGGGAFDGALGAALAGLWMLRRRRALQRNS